MLRMLRICHRVYRRTTGFSQIRPVLAGTCPATNHRMSAWTCPNCARRVPGHVEACRCGAARTNAAEPVPATAPAPDSAKAPAGKRVIGLTSAIIGGIVGSFLVKTLMSSGLGSGSTVPLEVLTKTADKINKMLPIMVDGQTQLVNTIGMPNTFVYQYRLVNVSLGSVESAALAEVERIQRRQVTNLACTTPETRDNLLNKGVTMRYQYADSEGRQVVRFDVKSSDCSSSAGR